jgi:hypothetical protein
MMLYYNTGVKVTCDLIKVQPTLRIQKKKREYPEA